MMIETKEFSHDLIYDQAQDFLLSKGITKKNFRLSRPQLVHQQNLVDNITLEEGHAFGLSPHHHNWSDFLNYLEEKYSFESKIYNIIKDYDEFFNPEKYDDCYKEYAYYFINASGTLQKVYVFEFNELDYGDYDMSLFEVNDSNIEEMERKVLDYYIGYFGKPIPEELIKPLASMTPEERQVIRMICI
jgi:hypothetical protein